LAIKAQNQIALFNIPCAGRHESVDCGIPIPCTHLRWRVIVDGSQNTMTIDWVGGGLENPLLFIRTKVNRSITVRMVLY